MYSNTCIQPRSTILILVLTIIIFIWYNIDSLYKKLCAIFCENAKKNKTIGYLLIIHRSWYPHNWTSHIFLDWCTKLYFNNRVRNALIVDTRVAKPPTHASTNGGTPVTNARIVVAAPMKINDKLKAVCIVCQNLAVFIWLIALDLVKSTNACHPFFIPILKLFKLQKEAVFEALLFLYFSY